MPRGKAKTKIVEAVPEQKAERKVPAFVTFFGVLFLLIGLFFSTRTLVNIALYPKYPTAPSTSLAGLTGFSQNISEESCSYSALGAGGEADQTCLKIVSDTREAARSTDVTNSLFFLFVGLGILYTQKRFFGES